MCVWLTIGWPVCVCVSVFVFAHLCVCVCSSNESLSRETSLLSASPSIMGVAVSCTVCDGVLWVGLELLWVWRQGCWSGAPSGCHVVLNAHASTLSPPRGESAVLRFSSTKFVHLDALKFNRLNYKNVCTGKWKHGQWQTQCFFIPRT